MMKDRNSGIAILLGTGLLALSCAPLQAEPAGDREKALQLVGVLERQPGTPAAKEAAGQLLVWLVEVPDLTVHACASVVGPLKQLKNLPAQLSTQVMFSQAAYQIRNPEADPKSLEVYLAGVEGTLRTYEAWKAAHPKRKNKLLEKLLVMKREGLLAGYVEGRLRECEKGGA